MKTISLLLCTLMLMMGTGAALRSQGIDSEKEQAEAGLLGSNAEGTHFIVAFMENEFSEQMCDMLYGRMHGYQRIALASRHFANVVLKFQNGATLTVALRPFDVREISLDGESFECLGEGICDKSVEIVSDAPINVYCFSSKEFTSDGYLALPTSSWGTSYYTANYSVDHYERLSQTEDPYNCNGMPRGGEFAIIASEDFTTVEVEPTANTAGGIRAFSKSKRTLMKGDVWQVQDGGQTRGGSDITGSKITSSKPVGLLSGHIRTSTPVWSYSMDHLIEMLPPTTALGKRYMVVPFGGRRGGDLVRIIATEPATTVTVVNPSGGDNYTITNAGEFIELDLPAISVVTTSKPSLVAHYSRSNTINQYWISPTEYIQEFVDPKSAFDPDMVVVTPEEQFVNAAVFQTMSSNIVKFGQYDSHFVTLVVELSGLPSLRINDRPYTDLAPLVQAVPGLEEEYAAVTVQLPAADAHAIVCEGLFGGYVYGIGPADSYAWPVGAGLRDLEAVDRTPPVLSATPECGGQVWHVVATDTVKEGLGIDIDQGLEKVELDPVLSENVQMNGPFLGKYDGTYGASVRLTDPTKPGFARVIATDTYGQSDTIDLGLEVRVPEILPDAVLYAEVVEGRIEEQLVKIRNPYGDGWMTIDSVKLARGEEFKFTNGSNNVRGWTLPAGGFHDLKIAFHSEKPGFYSDTLICWVDCRQYKIPLQASVAVPVINTHDLDFGALRVGKKDCLELRVSNTGRGLLRISKVRLESGRIFSFDQETGGPRGEIVLQPGTDTTIIICFEPDAATPFTGQVFFESNAQGGDSIAALTGRGIKPVLRISGFDFGEIQIGDTSCTRVPIINIGTDTAHLTGIWLENQQRFIVDESVFPHDLPPGDTLWVPVCFSPIEEISSGSDIQALNSDGLEAGSQLIGKGYDVIARISGYDWGERWVNTRHDYTVYITNTGSREIEITSVWLDPAGDIGDFEIITPVPVIRLAPGERYPVEVRFTPLMRGKRIINIYASTSSRVTPVIDSVLEGFGIEAIPDDELIHDSSLAFSCDTRVSRILLYNRGNAPLTLDQVRIANPTGHITLNAPGSGSVIPVGDAPLELELITAFDGFVGRVEATVTWSFQELRGETFSRSIFVESSQQQFVISAISPPTVGIEDPYDLVVTVDSVLWQGLLHRDVMLDIVYNPTVGQFDEKVWYEKMTETTGDWAFVGAPVYPEDGRVLLHLRPRVANAATLDGETLPPIPFKSFLGDERADTFRVTFTADSGLCALPALAASPYSIDSICGLNTRLLVIAGEPPALRPVRPNPASTTVLIEFTLPFQMEAKLELIDLNGRTEPIIEGMLPAGDHTKDLDVREMPNGTYYYRLTAGDFVETRRFVVRR